MLISNLWKKRIMDFQKSGNDFTYDEIADMAGVSRGNVSVVIRKMEEERPDIVERLEDGNKLRFRFNYEAVGAEEATVDDGEFDIPDWLSEETYNNLLDRIDIPDGYEIKLDHLDWVRQFQRGGLRIYFHEVGQKYPEYNMVLRVDNCIILN